MGNDILLYTIAAAILVAIDGTLIALRPVTALQVLPLFQMLMQKSTHWNPRANVRQSSKNRPSVPANLTC